MGAWRLAAFIAIAGIAVLFQFFIRDSTPTDITSDAAFETSAQTCIRIRKAILTKSNIYLFGSQQYQDDNAHWIPNADEISQCSVEPGTVADVQQIMRVLRDSTTRFAIKSGGYTFNKGWSSTTGVQIALIRLNQVTYDAKTNTVTMGMGNTWNRLFAILEKQGITVSGGRIDGVGVGGFLLGGGYSYLTDESGLSMDNVISYEVVLPNATVVTASSTSYPDLFWGLKGGFNNFGIVTSAVVRAYSIGKVYGGEMNFTGSALPLLANAIEKFTLMQNSTEAVKKGGIVMAYVVQGPNPPIAIVQLFYNGVNPPARMLAPFKDIPGNKSLKVYDTFTELIDYMSPLFQNPGQNRAASSTASVYRITAPIILQFWKIIYDLYTN